MHFIIPEVISQCREWGPESSLLIDHTHTPLPIEGYYIYIYIWGGYAFYYPRSNLAMSGMGP